jgi:uncharacterized membrane protein (UPF0127 family)
MKRDLEMSEKYRQLREAETGRIVVARLELADTAWKQAIGLLGRRALAGDAGLCLSPCNGIHTLGMRFALDVLFLDRNGMALRLAANVRPWRICGPMWRARTVIELPAGTLARQQLAQGRRYEVVP